MQMSLTYLAVWALCGARFIVIDPMAWLQMLVRAHVAANTDVQTLPGGSLSDKELQEGLMAGYGTRARRKHFQRHARKLGAHRSMQQALLTEEDQNSNNISASSEDDSRIPNSASCSAKTPAPAAGTSVATGRLFEGSCSSTHGSVQEHDANAVATTVSKETHSIDETAADAAQTSERPINRGEQNQSAAPRTSVTDLGRGGHFWHGERYGSLLGKMQTTPRLQLRSMHYHATRGLYCVWGRR